MTTPEILEHLAQEYPECLLADGYEDAILGVIQGACRPTVVCYDYSRCMEILTHQGMSEADADEWLQFNTTGAYLGEQTPFFLHNWREL